MTLYSYLYAQYLKVFVCHLVKCYVQCTLPQLVNRVSHGPVGWDFIKTLCRLHTAHSPDIDWLANFKCAHHLSLLLSDWRVKADKRWSCRCCLSSSFIALSSSLKLLHLLCVLPHGFTLQQCVALVITSCLKQTDGIRESDGQFSQCICTLLLFCVCVLYAGFLTSCHLLHSAQPLTPSYPPYFLPASLSSVDVCLCVDVGNYLTDRVSPGQEQDSLISCSCVGHFRCQVSLWTSSEIAAIPFSLFSLHGSDSTEV